MIMKVFKHIGKGLNDREQYLKQMDFSNIAHFLLSNTTILLHVHHIVPQSMFFLFVLLRKKKALARNLEKEDSVWSPLYQLEYSRSTATILVTGMKR
jgi:hypothetical protein